MCANPSWGYHPSKRELRRRRLIEQGYTHDEVEEFEAEAEDRDYDEMRDREMESMYRDIWDAARKGNI